MKKDLEELYKILVSCLKEMGISQATTTATALMLRTKDQLLTMLDWINKHHKEKPDEDRVLNMAELISQKVK